MKIVLIRLVFKKKQRLDRKKNFSMKFLVCIAKKSDNTSAYFSMKMLGHVTLRYETNLDKVIHCWCNALLSTEAISNSRFLWNIVPKRVKQFWKNVLVSTFVITIGQYFAANQLMQ